MKPEEDKIVYYQCAICDYESNKMEVHCFQLMGAVWLHELGDFDEL